MSNLNEQYLLGIKRQVIQSLRKVYDNPAFPDTELANKINIELDFPIIQERYPAIYIAYSEQFIQDAGLGHYTLESDSTNTVQLYRHWFFSGNIIFNVMALDPIERDEISNSIMNIFAFGKENSIFKPFRDTIYNEDFVSLQPMLSAVNPSGNQTSPAPWGNNTEFIYINSYSISTFGSFISTKDNGTLIQISKVIPYPYTPDQNVPKGSTNSLDTNIPWTLA